MTLVTKLLTTKYPNSNSNEQFPESFQGEAKFVLVIQKHPKLVTYKAQAYRIKCVYNTGEQNINLGFNVSTLTTAGTISNTGPPPTCTMRIANSNGEDISQAEIGDELMLQVGYYFT